MSSVFLECRLTHIEKKHPQIDTHFRDFSKWNYSLENQLLIAIFAQVIDGIFRYIGDSFISRQALADSSRRGARPSRMPGRKKKGCARPKLPGHRQIDCRAFWSV